MKPHPRIRKTIKWGGAAVTVLLVVVWIGSGWFHWSKYLWDGWSIGGGHGEASIIHLPQLDALLRTPGAIANFEMLANRREPFYMGWWFDQPVAFGTSGVAFPLWLPPLITLAIAAFAWRLDTLARRRERAHLCPKCGYDRTGILKDAKCPECGHAPA